MRPYPFNYPSINYSSFVLLQSLNANHLEEFRFVRSGIPEYYLLQYRWRETYEDTPPWRTVACVDVDSMQRIKKEFDL